MNEAKLNELLGKMVTELGAAFVGASVIIGEQLGLYKALAANGALTSSQLAERTGTTERYIREWLSGQTASGYIEYNAANQTFHLTPEQMLVFTNADSPVLLTGGFHILQSIYSDVPRMMRVITTRSIFVLARSTPDFVRVGVRPPVNYHLTNVYFKLILITTNILMLKINQNEPMRKSQQIAGITLLLLLLFCNHLSATAEPIASDNFSGQWWLTSLLGGPVGAIDSPITMNVTQILTGPTGNGTIPPPSTERVYGMAGCNNYLTTYTVGSTNQLHFDYPSTTKVYCGYSIMKTEHEFIDALTQVVRYEMSEVDSKPILVMFNQSGEAVLTFASKLPANNIFLPAIMR